MLGLNLFLASQAVDYRALTELQRMILEANLNAGDRDGAIKRLADWKLTRQTTITRYVPGRHYHVLGTKFDTDREARDHARHQGYTVAGYRVVHVYAGEGD